MPAPVREKFRVPADTPFANANDLWHIEAFAGTDNRVMHLAEDIVAFSLDDSRYAEPPRLAKVHRAWKDYEAGGVDNAFLRAKGYETTLGALDTAVEGVQVANPSVASEIRALRERVWKTRLEDYRDQIDTLNEDVEAVNEQMWVRTAALVGGRRTDLAGKLRGFYLTIDNHSNPHHNVVIEDKKGRLGKLDNLMPALGIYIEEKFLT